MSTQSLVTLTSGGESAATYWPYATPSVTWPVCWPATYYYYQTVPYDKGERAFRVAQALVDKHLVRAVSAEQFITLMQTLLDVL